MVLTYCRAREPTCMRPIRVRREFRRRLFRCHGGVYELELAALRYAATNMSRGGVLCNFRTATGRSLAPWRDGRAVYVAHFNRGLES